jgi:hypothetical protein
MKRALIAIASVGGLVPAAWLVEANAQQMSPASPPSQAYAPSQMAPTQAYAQQRRARRYAHRAPAAPAAAASSGTVYGSGSGAPPYAFNVPGQRYALAPWEWHAAPGPNRRGNMCITHTDPLRGYGYQATCK